MLLYANGYSFDFKEREFTVEHGDTVLGVVVHTFNRLIWKKEVGRTP